MPSTPSLGKPSDTSTDIKLRKVKVGYTFRYVFWDFFARWGVWLVWWVSGKKWWETFLFWVAQLLVLPLVIIAMALDNEWEVEEETRAALRREEDIPENTLVLVSPQIPPWGKLVTLVIAIAGAWAGAWSTRIEQKWLVWVVGTVFFILYGVYLAVLNDSSLSQQRDAKSEEDVVSRPRMERKPLEKDELSQTPGVEEERDYNDVAIARLEVLAQSLAQRVDTYTLEAALFGALAFSSFVSILFSDYPLLRKLGDLLQQIRAFHLPSFSFTFDYFLTVGREISPLLHSVDALYVAMSMETVVCSMFFLAVLVTRLRFGDLLHASKYAIQVAKIYNDKEEDMYQLSPDGLALTGEQANRVHKIQRQIRKMVDRAEVSLTDAEDVVAYMKLFRNLGVWLFVLVLITSGFLLTWVLGVFFVTLYFLVGIYPQVDKYTEQQVTRALRRSLRLRKRSS